MHVLAVGFVGTITPDTDHHVVVNCAVCGLRVFEGRGALRVEATAYEHHCPDTTSQTAEWSMTFTPAEVELPLPLDSVDLDA